MENLNDAEFGSDNSGEEAPILVAQRYLNIFRQVHIFNKAKRDEFDEELLSLPDAGRALAGRAYRESQDRKGNRFCQS